jgi:hypothetical protein
MRPGGVLAASTLYVATTTILAIAIIAFVGRDHRMVAIALGYAGAKSAVFARRYQDHCDPHNL